jgi:uncharacterized membrane protein YdfJ with MMPL/SSD domain
VRAYVTGTTALNIDTDSRLSAALPKYVAVVVWIFQDGHLTRFFDVSNPGPVLSFLPILLIGILFGRASRSCPASATAPASRRPPP